MNPQESSRRLPLDRIQRHALTWGIASLVVCAILYFHAAGQFYRSYLMAYIFWVSIPLGCLGILMLHHLTGGLWGHPIRRLLEAASRTFLLMAVLFIPVWLGMSHLYSWTNPAATQADPEGVLAFKKAYLTPAFFTLRAGIYFAVWFVLAYFLNRWSREQDRTADPGMARRLSSLSGPGLVLWGLLATAASIDWVMSLEPEWFSTIYGMTFMVIEALVAMSFVILALRMLAHDEPIRDAVSPAQFNDLGNLMLTFVLLWAYLSFSQFLLIWSGNLKDEIPWYMVRAFGGWGAVAAVLIVLHFFVPFFLLLQRPIKRRLRALSLVAGFLIVLSLVDVYWLVVPAYQKSGPRLHWLDVFAVIGIGGIWIATFLWQLKKLPLLPEHDPRFEGALNHGD
jgi:hypothetical protein